MIYIEGRFLIYDKDYTYQIDKDHADIIQQILKKSCCCWEIVQRTSSVEFLEFCGDQENFIGWLRKIQQLLDQWDYKMEGECEWTSADNVNNRGRITIRAGHIFVDNIVIEYRQVKVPDFDEEICQLPDTLMTCIRCDTIQKKWGGSACGMCEECYDNCESDEEEEEEEEEDE